MLPLICSYMFITDAGGPVYWFGWTVLSRSDDHKLFLPSHPVLLCTLGILDVAIDLFLYVHYRCWGSGILVWLGSIKQNR
ncbi:unnamed protein product [Linum trigynum]|uniref:Uncharacterized protein n=1 Tax=Linum trigynum TaxID=586398 RepID=A0AAV2GKK5_9ROSI